MSFDVLAARNACRCTGCIFSKSVFCTRKRRSKSKSFMLSFDNRSGNGDADSNGSETKLKYMIEKMAMKKKMKMVFMMMMTMSARQWAQGRSWPAGWDGSRCRSPTRSAEKNWLSWWWWGWGVGRGLKTKSWNIKTRIAELGVFMHKFTIKNDPKP